jgi:hypothetical protein
MKVTAVTGAFPRDYIELVAETVAECAQLVRISQSTFLPKEDTLLTDQGVWPNNSLALRIFVGPKKPELPVSGVLARIDATP